MSEAVEAMTGMDAMTAEAMTGIDAMTGEAMTTVVRVMTNREPIAESL